MALAEAFDPERDRVVWDVGHQAYAWKILTGRGGRFGSIRTLGGLSPFLDPAESPADAAVSGHAGSALSVAAGFALCPQAARANTMTSARISARYFFMFFLLVSDEGYNPVPEGTGLL